MQDTSKHFYNTYFGMAVLGMLVFFVSIFSLGSVGYARQPDDYADLVVKNISRVEDRLYAGRKGAYKIEVANIGNRRAYDARVSIRFNDQSVCGSTISIDPDETRTFWCGFTSHVGGVLIAGAVLDEKDDVAELRNDNNSLYVEFPIIPSEERPDMSARDLSIEGAEPLHTGDDVQFSVTVVNNKKWETGPFSVNWYLGDADTAVCTERVSLASQEQTQVICQVPDLSVQEHLVLNVVIDERDRIAETIESNNTLTQEYPVFATRPVPVRLTVDPPTPPVDEAVEIDDQQPAGTTNPSVSLSFEARANLLLRGLVLERDLPKEIQFASTDFVLLRQGLPLQTPEQERALRDFAVYGVDERTRALGHGERVAALYSYKQAFNKLPGTTDELADVLRITHGLWPVEQSREAQDQAHKAFYKLYERIANMGEVAERTAIATIAYGLRQEVRDLVKERVGVEAFRRAYGRNPQTVFDWNVVQAVAYTEVTHD